MQAGGEQSPADTEEGAEHNDAGSRSDQPVIEQQSVPTIHLDVVGVLLDGFWVASLPHVIEHITQLHGPKALQVWAVWVALLIRKRMVLPVHGHPLLGRQAGGDPQRESEKPRD